MIVVKQMSLLLSVGLRLGLGLRLGGSWGKKRRERNAQLKVSSQSSNCLFSYKQLKNEWSLTSFLLPGTQTTLGE